MRLTPDVRDTWRLKVRNGRRYSMSIETKRILGFLFSLLAVSNSLQPHRLQLARLRCPSPSLGACPDLPSIESGMPSNSLVLCHPLFLLPSIFPSIRVFSNELALHIRWPKYWSFSINPSNEYSGLISFRID